MYAGGNENMVPDNRNGTGRYGSAFPLCLGTPQKYTEVYDGHNAFLGSFIWYLLIPNSGRWCTVISVFQAP